MIQCFSLDTNLVNCVQKENVRKVFQERGFCVCVLCVSDLVPGQGHFKDIFFLSTPFWICLIFYGA